MRHRLLGLMRQRLFGTETSSPDSCWINCERCGKYQWAEIRAKIDGYLHFQNCIKCNNHMYEKPSGSGTGVAI